jgi:glucosyl-dolichyl phosphate glucuronosyltransferase
VLVTVAICTRNRAAILRRALTALAECETPPNALWELVVVDNGSSDDTRSVVREFESMLPVRAITEPTPGLARARNTAVRSARGDYLVWTDDDCIVGRRWLAAYTRSFAQWPTAAIFGGPIIPRFEGQPPAWLTPIARRVETAYAGRDLGREPIALSLNENRVPFGANYAIRADVQRARLYDSALGRGSTIAVGEESEVLEGVLRDGGEGRWVPGADVTHSIPPSRQRVAYLRHYYAADGAHDEWRRCVGGVDDSPSSNGSALQLLGRAVRSETRYQLFRRYRPPEVWIDELISASIGWGRLRARWTLARDARDLGRGQA